MSLDCFAFFRPSHCANYSSSFSLSLLNVPFALSYCRPSAASQQVSMFAESCGFTWQQCQGRLQHTRCLILDLKVGNPLFALTLSLKQGPHPQMSYVSFPGKLLRIITSNPYTSSPYNLASPLNKGHSLCTYLISHGGQAQKTKNLALGSGLKSQMSF